MVFGPALPAEAGPELSVVDCVGHALRRDGVGIGVGPSRFSAAGATPARDSLRSARPLLRPEVCHCDLTGHGHSLGVHLVFLESKGGPTASLRKSYHSDTACRFGVLFPLLTPDRSRRLTKPGGTGWRQRDRMPGHVGSGARDLANRSLPTLGRPIGPTIQIEFSWLTGRTMRQLKCLRTTKFFA
jgi:hypothetical protein